jgi:hypothetical protein
MILPFLLLLALLQENFATSSSLEESGSAAGVYDRNSKHVSNRLYDALFIHKDQMGVTHSADALNPFL